MNGQPEIIIQSFNPYEWQLPGRRVVSRDTLLLIKRLRAQGCQVTMAPDNGTRLYYLAQKGVNEFFADPVKVTILQAAIGLVTGVIASLVADRIKTRPKPKDDKVRLVLESKEHGDMLRFDYKGRPLSDDQTRRLVEAFSRDRERYLDSSRVTSPDPARPSPIFFEHTPQIVGWGRVYVDEAGVLKTDTRITDDEVRDALEDGRMKGFSWGGLVAEATCNVCRQPYVNCDHVAGETYGGKKCVVLLESVEPVEISVVSDPVQVRIPSSKAKRSKS